MWIPICLLVRDRDDGSSDAAVEAAFERAVVGSVEVLRGWGSHVRRDRARVHHVEVKPLSTDVVAKLTS